MRVKATVTPTLDNVHVYFSWWDVDDPSFSPPYDPFDGPVGPTGPDNYGSGAGLSATTAVTDGSGQARVTFTVSMQPGDNFRVAASASEDELSEVNQLKVHGILPFPSAVELSEMLTVWRKLWIEQDSMGAVASTGNEKNYFSGTAASYEEKPGGTRVHFQTPFPSELDEDNQFTDGWYRVSGNFYSVALSGTDYQGRGYVDILDNDLTGMSLVFELFDDDYSSTGTPVITLPQCPSLGTWANEFRGVYIEPVNAGYYSVVPFDRNLSTTAVGAGVGSWNDSRSPLRSSADFWNTLVVTGFQPEPVSDNDPLTGVQVPLGVSRNVANEALVYLEVTREKGSNVGMVMTHEIGHTGGLVNRTPPETEHCSEDDRVMSDDLGSCLCNKCKKDMRSISIW